MKLKNNETEKIINNNIHKLIDNGIIKNAKDLENPTLDMIEKISDELNLCIKDIICCYCTLDKCIGNKDCYKK